MFEEYLKRIDQLSESTKNAILNSLINKLSETHETNGERWKDLKREIVKMKNSGFPPREVRKIEDACDRGFLAYMKFVEDIGKDDEQEP